MDDSIFANRRVLLGALAVLAVLIGVPSLWLVIAHQASANVAPAANTDFLSIVVALAGVMAGIFTVGGLVIALAAVLTVLTVEDKVTRQVERMRPQIEAQVEAQHEAYQTFIEARYAVNDWMRATELATKAIEQYPGLRPRASAYMADTLTRDVIDGFLGQHSARQMNMARGYPQPTVALRWVWAAGYDDPGADERYALREILLYAINREYLTMIGAIRRRLEEASVTLEELVTPERLPILVYATRYERPALPDLAALLHREIPLPPSSTEVLDSIKALDITVFNCHVDWIVIGKVDVFPNDQDTFPLAVHIFQLPLARDRGESEWRFLMQPGRIYNRPEIEEGMRIGRSPEEIVQVLSALFHFICQDTT